MVSRLLGQPVDMRQRTVGLFCAIAGAATAARPAPATVADFNRKLRRSITHLFVFFNVFTPLARQGSGLCPPVWPDARTAAVQTLPNRPPRGARRTFQAV